MNSGACGSAPGGSGKSPDETAGHAQPVGTIDAAPWPTTVSARTATRIDKPVNTGQSG